MKINRIIGIAIAAASCALIPVAEAGENSGSRYAKVTFDMSKPSFSLNYDIQNQRDSIIEKTEYYLQDTKKRVGGTLALGYYFTNNSRIEIAGSISDRSGSAKLPILSISNKSYSLFVNYYFDFTNGGAFLPYVKVGAGLSSNKVGLDLKYGSAVQIKNNGFAGAVGAGFAYNLSDNVFVDIGYAMQCRLTGGSKSVVGSQVRKESVITGKADAKEGFHKMYAQLKESAPGVVVTESSFSGQPKLSRFTHYISFGVGFRF